MLKIRNAFGLISHSVEVIDVPSNHITMNESPYVQVIAKRLKIALL
jgi:hypothetical protein